MQEEEGEQKQQLEQQEQRKEEEQEEKDQEQDEGKASAREEIRLFQVRTLCAEALLGRVPLETTLA